MDDLEGQLQVQEEYISDSLTNFNKNLKNETKDRLDDQKENNQS